MRITLSESFRVYIRAGFVVFSKTTRRSDGLVSKGRTREPISRFTTEELDEIRAMPTFRK